MPRTRSHSDRRCGVPSLPIVRTAVPVPAQFTPTRSGASSAATATASATCSLSVTSALTNLTPSSLARASPLSPLKSRIVTTAPAAFSRRAVASPSPDAPPVTIAAAPLMSMAGQDTERGATGPDGAGRRGRSRTGHPVVYRRTTVMGQTGPGDRASRASAVTRVQPTASASATYGRVVGREVVPQLPDPWEQTRDPHAPDPESRPAVERDTRVASRHLARARARTPRRRVGEVAGVYVFVDRWACYEGCPDAASQPSATTGSWASPPPSARRSTASWPSWAATPLVEAEVEPGLRPRRPTPRPSRSSQTCSAWP